MLSNYSSTITVPNWNANSQFYDEAKQTVDGNLVNLCSNVCSESPIGPLVLTNRGIPKRLIGVVGYRRNLDWLESNLNFSLIVSEKE